jgi:hypothetical protein
MPMKDVQFAGGGIESRRPSRSQGVWHWLQAGGSPMNGWISGGVLVNPQN